MLDIDPVDDLICLRAENGAGEGPVLPPVARASLYRKARIEDLLAGLARENEDFIYARGANPTVRAFEISLAKLERAEAAKAFASGMGAISATLVALVKSGDHILFVNNIYGPTIELAERLADFGVSHSRCFSPDAAAITQALRPETRIVYLESPGSTLFRVAPIAAIADLAHRAGALLVIDNTVATPLLQKPLTLGADLVIHSCSKYLGGHSDLVGGAVAGRSDLIERIFYKGYMLLGAAMAPDVAFLLLRGLMTLPARLRRHHDDALALAAKLGAHSRVKRVFHPAFCDADAALFAAQMRGHSGLFSVELDVDSFGALLARVNRLKRFGKAVSWGGVESLVMVGHKSDPGDAPTRIPRGLMRLSVGLEGVDALWADLERALA